MLSLDYLIFVTVAVNIVLGLVVFLRNPKIKTNKLFATFVAFLVVWMISNFLENEPNIVGSDWLGYFLHLDFLAAIFLLYVWFRFCAFFAKSKLVQESYRWLNRIFLSITTILGVLSLTPLIITDASFYDNVIHFKNGLLWPFYAFFILFFMLGGLTLLFFGRRRTKIAKQALPRQQISLVFLGFIVSFTNAAIVNLYLQPFQSASLEISRLGIYGMTFLVAFAAYAVIKRRFFDVKPIIARAVSYVVVILIFAIVYSFILLLIVGSFVFIDANLFVIFLVLMAITTLTFQPLEKLIRKATNRIFFKAYYDSDILLSKLTHIMAETIDLEDIINRLLEMLLSEVNISKGTFLIVKNHVITDTLGIGYANHALAIPQLEELFHQATGASSHFLFEDLEEGRLKQIFRKLDISIVIPIKVENTEVALLVLGGKKSGEIYYERDLEFLGTFASEAGIAIQNAQAYTEIKKFSKELGQRVEERTKELKSSQARELAEARNVARLKDEFVFIAAHELRTPVTAIKGFMELVSSSSVKLPRDIKENLNAISSASNVLNQLVGDLLEIARSESGTVKISVSPTNIAPIIKSVVSEMKPLAVQKKVKIRFEPRKTIPRILVDPEKVREVIMNLMSNGIKYNKADGTLDISVLSQKSKLVIKFKDSGYGIPKAQQGKIFEKFFRARVKGTQEVMGTGLGLFIVRMLVEKMDGNVAFTSTEGKGSVFMISFPVVTK